MDNIRFGSFVAQLRKERGLTQKELAQRLHVTDKAVSKWETGRGFPDLKLLEPLAQTLEVSLVELLQGERTSSPTLSVEEAGQVAARAMDQYQQTTVLRYLRLFRWVCTAAAVFCFLFLLPYLVYGVSQLYFHWVIEPQMGVIGSAEGPTGYHHFLGSPVPRLVPAGTAGPPVRRLRRTGFPAPLPGEEAEMKRLFPLLLTLLLFPLPGCGLGNGIPRGLDWQALTVTDQKGGALLSAAPGWEGGKDVPRLSLSVQVEADSVVLTRPETGERWSGTLAPGEALSDGTTAYPLSFPGAEAGWAVYGITEHTDGSREAALYLTAGGVTVYCTAPLSD